MAKDIILKVTMTQLLAIVDLTNDASAQIGTGENESDKYLSKQVKTIDRMLKKNGFKRDYK